MSPFFVIVANVQDQHSQRPGVINYQNWDIKSFDHYPKEEEIREVMRMAVASPDFGNMRTIRYIKIEKRYFPSEYSK